jgi:hypothetical protein
VAKVVGGNGALKATVHVLVGLQGAVGVRHKHKQGQSQLI